MRKIVHAIDAISDRVGKTACWLAALLVGLISLEVIMRYVFNEPTMWNYETSMMVGGGIFAAGWAYAMRHNSHVRIDVLYAHLSPRAKAGIDTFGYLLLFLPLMAMFISSSIAWTVTSWKVAEKSVETYWYPIMGPFRTWVSIGFILFFLQGTAQFVRDIYHFVKGKAYD
jgi:TRAP-type mannitol/chloroaromatic compound transport system permease small subunit